MRAADPRELTTPAVPVLAARLSENQLTKLVPVRFKELTNPEEVREPSKAALIQLTTGSYVVLFYGRESHELTVEVPQNVNLAQGLAAFLAEVPLPASCILWRRADITMTSQAENSKEGIRHSKGFEAKSADHLVKTAKGAAARSTGSRSHAGAARKSSKKR